MAKEHLFSHGVGAASNHRRRPVSAGPSELDATDSIEFRHGLDVTATSINDTSQER